MIKKNNYSITNIANKIRKGEISAKQIVENYISRIKEVNPQLNAVVQICEEQAFMEAYKADKELKEGKLRGVLHGVPMTIKDSFDSKGIITTGGTLGRKYIVPQNDSTVLERLKNAGAILLGKTNTSEFTLSYETNNLVYGRTNNPYDISRIPGGSSGGAAAIVAAGGSPLDIGSDYGGSLRYPAHCCGICTIKPTSGRVPRTGHILPFGGFLDFFQQVGPLTKTVKDLKFILPLICGPDNIDPSIVPMPLFNADVVNLRKLKVSFFINNGIITPSAETIKIIKKAVSILEADALIVEEKRPKEIEKTYDIMMQLLAADGGASIRRMLKLANTTNHSIPWLKLAQPATFEDFDQLIMEWYKFRSNMLGFFDNYDVLLCPVNAYQAVPHDALRDDLQSFSYTMSFNLTGNPVVVIRGGTSTEGLPIGIQIVAPAWREDIALAVAEYLEEKFGTFEDKSGF